MGEVKIIRLMITPQTKVNISDNEKWMLAPSITDEYLLRVGKKKREKQIEEGKDEKKLISEKAYLNRKNYMLRYFEYKRKVRELFYQSGLREYPTNNVFFKFYLPMPKSWSKKKRDKYCFEPHQSVCDASNLHKSLEDACSDADRKNWDYRAAKFWYPEKEGFIEIEIGAMQPAVGYRKYKKEDLLK